MPASSASRMFRTLCKEVPHVLTMHDEAWKFHTESYGDAEAQEPDFIAQERHRIAPPLPPPAGLYGYPPPPASLAQGWRASTPRAPARGSGCSSNSWPEFRASRWTSSWHAHQFQESRSRGSTNPWGSWTWPEDSTMAGDLVPTLGAPGHGRRIPLMAGDLLQLLGLREVHHWTFR